MTEEFLLFFYFLFFIFYYKYHSTKKFHENISIYREHVWPLYGINWESNLFRLIVNHQWPSIEIESFVYWFSDFFFAKLLAKFIDVCNFLQQFTRVYLRTMNERVYSPNVFRQCSASVLNRRGELFAAIMRHKILFPVVCPARRIFSAILFVFPLFPRATV